MLDRLPESSHYVAARRNDPAVAAQVAALVDAGTSPEWRPTAAGWTHQHELLALGFDRLGHWLAQHANTNRPKGAPTVKPPPPFPRPRTAVSVAVARAREARQNNVIDAVHAAQRRYAAAQQQGGG